MRGSPSFSHEGSLVVRYCPDQPHTQLLFTNTPTSIRSPHHTDRRKDWQPILNSPPTHQPHCYHTPQSSPFNKSQQTSPLHNLVNPLPITSICQFRYNKKIWHLNSTPILQNNTKHNHAISPIIREHEKQWLTHPLSGPGRHASQIVRQPPT